MLKKTFFIILLMMFMINSISKADITIQIPHVNYAPGTVFTVPVILYGASENGSPLSAINTVFTFDTTAVQFIQFLNFNPLAPQNQWFFSGNNQTGLVAANWLEPQLGVVAFPEGTVLYEVKFLAKPGATAFTFVTTEFLDEFYNEVPATLNHGSYASLQQVVFQVNMQDETVSANGVHIAGSFNGWSPIATPMAQNGESSIYSVMLPVISDSAYFYRFINGNSFSGYETVPAECSVTFEDEEVRLLNNPGGDATLMEVCFSSCSPCIPKSQITFRVEMNLETIDPSGVHIAGTFNNWDPSANQLNNIGGGIYGITLSLIIGDEIEYRFINGNTIINSETVPEQCGVPDGNGSYNRFVNIPENDSSLSVVCFSRCVLCPPTHEVTFSVDMANEVISPDGVHLAGSFNNFDPASIQMVNIGNNVFQVTLDLPEGDLITYRFVNGADASGFETVPATCGIDDGTGTYNRSFVVIEYNVVLDQVCFSACEDCPQPPGKTDITFKVDMNGETISPDGIHIAGTFNNWSTQSTQMVHLGNKIYSIILQLNENETYQYRFVNGNTPAGYETVPVECGYTGNSGGLERQIIVPIENIVLNQVCFSSCSACVYYDVIVRVDMMKEELDPAGVHIAGNFNNWDPSANEMISSGSTIYEAVIPVIQGDSLVYRFINGNQMSKMEVVPDECGWLYNETDFARLVVPADDLETDTVCFSLCVGCTVGIMDISDGVHLETIFPNPATNHVFIPLTLPENCDATFILRDVMGSPLQTDLYRLSEGYHEVKLNVQNLSRGIYFIQYLIKGNQITKQGTHKLLINK